MTSKKSIKNKVVGKLKQVEGKITKDKVREAEGKAQETHGKAQAKADELKKSSVPGDHKLSEWQSSLRLSVQ